MNNEILHISDLSVGEQISTSFLLSAYSFRKSKIGKTFLSCTVTDGVQSMPAMLWDYSGEEIVFQLNAVYTFTGTVGAYNDAPQLTLKAVPILDMETPAGIFAKVCLSDSECAKSLKSIYDLIDKCWTVENGAPFAYFARATLSRFSDKQLMSASGAKSVHHAGVGGWVAHTLDVTRMAFSIALNTDPRLWRTLGGEGLSEAICVPMVIAGAVLHDIGKIYTYEYDGPALDMSFTGALHDHILIGTQVLCATAGHWFDGDANCGDKICEGYLKAGEVKLVCDLLTHIIASHHLTREYGAAVIPYCAEAFIVHHADALSAELEIIREATAITPKDKLFTNKIWALDGKQIPLGVVNRLMSHEHQGGE
jgi:3'-5' exoribonuclease